MPSPLMRRRSRSKRTPRPLERTSPMPNSTVLRGDPVILLQDFARTESSILNSASREEGGYVEHLLSRCATKARAPCGGSFHLKNCRPEQKLTTDFAVTVMSSNPRSEGLARPPDVRGH